MALNKFMHPRNRYRTPPDFKALAIKYPEFRKYAQQDIAGKVKIDFKNLEAMRALTSTLLKEDFDLEVEIPLNRLIPTLPLRLNYLLWIEDIMQINQRTSDVKGIDIGCGASCVYPLLAAKHFGWNMLATEVDLESAFIASRNVRKNKLADMIKVKNVDKDQMLDGVILPNPVYDFCMCNPPFFGSEEELNPQNVSRSPNRPPPRNARSGAIQELVAPGGETAFVAKIIQDSVKLKAVVRVYSVMVGHKTSVGKVKLALEEAEVTKVATSEFCQGRTTRWGVAWTLDPTIVLDLPKASPTPAKQKTPFNFKPEKDVATTVKRLHELLDQLQIAYKTLKKDLEVNIMEINAPANTWSNSRKKRRQEKTKQASSEAKTGNPEEETLDKNNETCEGIDNEGGDDKEKGKTVAVKKTGEGKQFIGPVQPKVDANGSEKGNEDFIGPVKPIENNENESLKTSDKINEDKSFIGPVIPMQDDKKENEETCDIKNNEKPFIGPVKPSTSGENEETDDKIAKDKIFIGPVKPSTLDDENGGGDHLRSYIEDGCEDNELQIGIKRHLIKQVEYSEETAAKKSKTENYDKNLNYEAKKNTFLSATVVVRKTEEGSQVEVTWLRGPGGKEAAHQVLQYFKNNFKTE